MRAFSNLASAMALGLIMADPALAQTSFVMGLTTGYGGFSTGGILGAAIHNANTNMNMAALGSSSKDEPLFSDSVGSKNGAFSVDSKSTARSDNMKVRMTIQPGETVTVTAPEKVIWDMSKVSGAQAWVENGKAKFKSQGGEVQLFVDLRSPAADVPLKRASVISKPVELKNKPQENDGEFSVESESHAYTDSLTVRVRLQPGETVTVKAPEKVIWDMSKVSGALAWIENGRARLRSQGGEVEVSVSLLDPAADSPLKRAEVRSSSIEPNRKPKTF